MRAALSRRAGEPLTIEPITLDEPGDGRVTVRIEASAVCMTDGLILGDSPDAPRPCIPGHSASGIVEAVGPNVVKTKVGDRVVIAGSMECGLCYPCTHGSPSQCDWLWRDTFAPPAVGRTGDGERVVGIGGVGTFAEYSSFAERNFAVVPSGLPAEQLALLGCGGISGVGAVLEVGRVRAGDHVLVLGCGHLGLWMIQAARLAGAAQIIAVEPIAERRGLAGRLGATAVVDPAAEEPKAVVDRLTANRGVDVSLEATGEAGGVETAFSLTRNGGVVVATSMVAPIGTSTITLPLVPAAVFGKQLRGSQSGGGHLNRDLPRIADLIERGLLDAAALVSRTFPLTEAGAAMEAAAARRLLTGVLLPHT